MMTVLLTPEVYQIMASGLDKNKVRYSQILHVYVLVERLLTLRKREWEGVEVRHGTCCIRHDLCLSSGRPCKPLSPLWLDRGSLSLEKRREERWWHKLLLLRGAPVITNRLSVGSVTTHCHPKMWCFKTTQTDVNRCVMLAQHIKHGSMFQPVILNCRFRFRTQICGNPVQLKMCTNVKQKCPSSSKVMWPEKPSEVHI